MATSHSSSMLIFILLSPFLNNATLSQEPAYAPSSLPEQPDCTSALLNLSSCLTYVEEGSKVNAPEKGCCPGLADLVNNNPTCLCQLIGGSNAFGLQIDTAKALMLPAACRVSTPPVSLCSVLGIPVASPMDIVPSPVSGNPDHGSGPGMPEVSSPSTNHKSRTLSAFDLSLFTAIVVFFI